MGHDPSGSRQVWLYALLIACAALALAHFIFQAAWDRAAYFLTSAIVGMTLFGRFSEKSEAWLRTPDEQSLLKLSPAFPSGGALKLLMIRSLWPGIPGDLGVWAAFSALALSTGWIGLRDALIATGALASLILTCFGLVMCYLAHSRMRGRMWLPMFHLLFAIIGGAVMIFAWVMGHAPSVLVGAILLLAPLLLAACAFALRPMQFPVRPHGKSPQWP